MRVHRSPGGVANRVTKRPLDGGHPRLFGALNVEPLAHELPASGLSECEQAVLVEGGLRLERTAGRDLVAEGAVRFAALVERSLTADEVARRLQVTPGRVHQLMSSGELYSFRLDGKRLIPGFQLVDGKLIANIMQVNKRLPPTVHPLGVFAWYHVRNGGCSSATTPRRN